MFKDDLEFSGFVHQLTKCNEEAFKRLANHHAELSTSQKERILHAVGLSVNQDSKNGNLNAIYLFTQVYRFEPKMAFSYASELYIALEHATGLFKLFALEIECQDSKNTQKEAELLKKTIAAGSVHAMRRNAELYQYQPNQNIATFIIFSKKADEFESKSWKSSFQKYDLATYAKTLKSHTEVNDSFDSWAGVLVSYLLAKDTKGANEFCDKALYGRQKLIPSILEGAIQSLRLIPNQEEDIKFFLQFLCDRMIQITYKILDAQKQDFFKSSSDFKDLLSLENDHLAMAEKYKQYPHVIAMLEKRVQIYKNHFQVSFPDELKKKPELLGKYTTYLGMFERNKHDQTENAKNAISNLFKQDITRLSHELKNDKELGNARETIRSLKSYAKMFDAAKFALDSHFDELGDQLYTRAAKDDAEAIKALKDDDNLVFYLGKYHLHRAKTAVLFFFDNPAKDAFSCFEKAEKNGNPYASKQLAICYMQGIGTDKDLEKAIEFLYKSASNADQESQHLLEEITNEINNSPLKSEERRWLHFFRNMYLGLLVDNAKHYSEFYDNPHWREEMQKNTDFSEFVLKFLQPGIFKKRDVDAIKYCKLLQLATLASKDKKYKQKFEDVLSINVMSIPSTHFNYYIDEFFPVFELNSFIEFVLNNLKQFDPYRKILLLYYAQYMSQAHGVTKYNDQIERALNALPGDETKESCKKRFVGKFSTEEKAKAELNSAQLSEEDALARMQNEIRVALANEYDVAVKLNNVHPSYNSKSEKEDVTISETIEKDTNDLAMAWSELKHRLSAPQDSKAKEELVNLDQSDKPPQQLYPDLPKASVAEDIASTYKRYVPQPIQQQPMYQAAPVQQPMYLEPVYPAVPEQEPMYHELQLVYPAVPDHQPMYQEPQSEYQAVPVPEYFVPHSPAVQNRFSFFSAQDKDTAAIDEVAVHLQDLSTPAVKAKNEMLDPRDWGWIDDEQKDDKVKEGILVDLNF